VLTDEHFHLVLFTVRVGVFRDVKSADFDQVKPYGFVYGITAEDQTTEVFVGQYKEQAKATKIATDLVAQGFRNAQAFALPLASGQQVTVIQIALHSGSRPMEWASLERAGPLFVESIDGLTKIMTGLYPDAATANQYLPAIRQLGFRDAFIKQINNVRLIPIGTFETGIKKPLIPITLQDAPPPATASTGTAPATNQSVQAYPPATNTALGPQTYSPPPTAPAAAPTSNVAPANLPAIDGRTKRSSAAELQRVLKEKGYYEGAIDGYYGPGTTAAFAAAWQQLPEVAKYRRLVNPATDVVSQWPEVAVLLAISEDLAAGNTNQNRANILAQQRPQLFAGSQSLNPAAATRVNNWATTVWSNLDDWATEDPLHARIFSAFRLAYHQSQVRLENHFQQLGQSPDSAKNLAAAMLQTLVGAQLDRFL
ncbi:MAG: peptidoglycan-binding domain-containing protein, partial [Bacteroidota bacterium]